MDARIFDVILYNPMFILSIPIFKFEVINKKTIILLSNI